MLDRCQLRSNAKVSWTGILGGQGCLTRAGSCLKHGLLGTTTSRRSVFKITLLDVSCASILKLLLTLSSHVPPMCSLTACQHRLSVGKGAPSGG